MNTEFKRRILIVDDTPANLLALRAVLEPLGAFIQDAASGKEALSRIAENPYDAIVMDIRMPGMDGFETAERMRADLDDNTTPILFLTASDILKEDVVRAYAQGHAELMPKPFVPEAMREKVRTFLEIADRHEERQDQSDRKVMEAEERLQLALTAAHMVAWVWDRHSDALVCSDGAVELFGYPIAQVSGFLHHVHEEDRPRLRGALETVWAGEQDLDVEFRVLLKDESVRWIESKGRLIKGIGGMSRMFGVSMDVTSKRASQTEMQELNAALKIARDKALYATHAKSVFLNAFGHELKTPLNGIINFAEMIEEEMCGKGAEQVCDDARKIRNLGAQLNKVVDQISNSPKSTNNCYSNSHPII